MGIGTDFTGSRTKSAAITKVHNALILSTEKSIKHAVVVMSDLVSKLARSDYFDENDILTEDRRMWNFAMTSMCDHPSKCIKGMKGSGNKGRQSKQQLHLLTGISAVFIPPVSHVPLGISCTLLNLNCNSNHVKKGI